MGHSFSFHYFTSLFWVEYQPLSFRLLGDTNYQKSSLNYIASLSSTVATRPTEQVRVERKLLV